MSSVNSGRPLVSVCVITYNHEPYIQESLEGILRQVVDFSVEIVVGEDCSTDNTLKICQEYAHLHSSKINLLPSTKNFGLIQNFVRTLQACQGEYIALCEGDDYWTDPHKLQKQISFLKGFPTMTFCFHAATVLNENSKSFYPYYKHRGFKTGIIRKDWLFEKGGGSFCTASAMFKRSILKYPDWFVQAPTGDFPLMLLAVDAGDIGFIDEVMCVYRSANVQSWSLSFKDFRTYKNYFDAEERMIACFDHDSGHKYSTWISRLNYLRIYRLIVFFNRFEKSIVARFRFLMSFSGRLNNEYFLKSLVNIFRSK
jgi:glycosyltransferase involved in cell wall biosynthesis